MLTVCTSRQRGWLRKQGRVNKQDWARRWFELERHAWDGPEGDQREVVAHLRYMEAEDSEPKDSIRITREARVAVAPGGNGCRLLLKCSGEGPRVDVLATRHYCPSG
jgi:hypothetical protein